MISRFFIDRPIFANVIAILTVIFGVVAMAKLPVERYPAIIPPTVVVSTNYPGANAKTIADTVAAPIEQQVNGVENMMYMSSTCSADGGYSLTLTFEIGTNLDQAQVQVQNRVATAVTTLPEEVQRLGLTFRKQSSSIVLAVSITSKDGTYDGLFLSNYATLRLRDELSRVTGVGDVVVRGAGAYAMRLWLNPDLLTARKLTTQDVIAALQRQNVQVAAGQVGQPPVPTGQVYQYTVTTLGRLTEPAEFEGIVLKASDDGRLTYLRDVGRVELGAQSYDSFASKTGLRAANVLVYQLPGSNAVEVAQAVRVAMKRISQTFPPGMEYDIPFDTTKFVDAAISQVYETLAEAGILVLIVILVFLQNWRALLVPATTVPVTIIGAFAMMPFLGFSINLLTLFGLVLAIGIVVDDAIVIVENASHHIEQGMRPREATIQAMSEVTGPVIAITCVLMAVFVPTAFLGGITGQLYRQFALTIAATAFISAINAMTLKPAQCATWLRPHSTRRGWFTRLFDFFYRPLERVYAWSIRGLVRFWWLVLIVFAAIVGGTGYWYTKLPPGFLPTEDQGYVIVPVQLPDAASLERTDAVVEKINVILREYQDEGVVENWFALGGFSLLDGTNTPNAATVFIAWTDWALRTRPEQQQAALVARLNRELSSNKDARIFVITPPAIQGLGVAGGFKMQLEDREGVGLDELLVRTQMIAAAAQKRADVVQLQPVTFRPAVPQLYLDIDRVKAEKMGVKANDIFATLQADLGSYYVNDFNKFNRTYQVRLQADAEYRRTANDIGKLQVRNQRTGDMVPLGTLLSVEERPGPPTVTRYNLYPTASISGAAAPGKSSGDAIEAMEELAAQSLPGSMGYDWTDIAVQEKRVAGSKYTVLGLEFQLSEKLIIMIFAVLLVYFVLAAQYESWILPFAVILVVPLGLLGVVAGTWLRAFDSNVYTQIGIILIIALASKNAILIVEFARELRMAGRTIPQAAIDAAKLRFRPILMTSFAFILGVVPLVFATGAGAASRQSLGTAVFGGMITSTILAVFFVPVFFVAMQYLSELRHGPAKPHAPPPVAEGIAHEDHHHENGTPNGKPAHPEKIPASL